MPFSRQVFENGSIGKRDRAAVGSVSVCAVQIDRQLGVRRSRDQRPSVRAWTSASTTIGSSPFLSALLRKMSANDVLMTARNP